MICFSQVIGRIFYVVDRNWNGRLSATEIRRSNLLQTLQQLEEEPDINQVRNRQYPGKQEGYLTS